MLVLTRKRNQSIVVNDNIEITNKNGLESLRYIRYDYGNGYGRTFVYITNGYPPQIYLYNN